MEQAKIISAKQNISLEKAIWYKTPPIYRKETQEETEKGYEINHLSFNAIKTLYQQYGRFFKGYVPLDLNDKYTLDELIDLKKTADLEYTNYPADSELLGDLGGLSEYMQEDMQEVGVNHIDEMFQEEYGNLFNTPKRDDGKVFSYIGYLNGYKFSEYGADELYLFFDADSKKAVIRLVYT